MRHRTTRRTAKLVLLGAHDVSDADLAEVGLLVARRLRKPFFRQTPTCATSCANDVTDPTTRSWLAAMLAVSGPAVIASSAPDLAGATARGDRCVVLVDTSESRSDHVAPDPDRTFADAVVAVTGGDRSALVDAISAAWSQWAERHDSAAASREATGSSPLRSGNAPACAPSIVG